jgi:protein-disulfide isomerase
VIVFGAIFALTGNKSGDSGDGSSGSSKPTSHVEGKSTSGVKLVEYGDFQCPYCGQAYAPIKQAVSDLGDKISFQFRNFPLTNMHKNAFAAARAAEAADMQGKFWQMHDALYESQAQWSESDGPSTFFNQLAKQIGLNVDKFKQDYASSAVNDRINADVAVGNKMKIQGTPAFYLDGNAVQLPYQDGAKAVEKVIQQAIDSKTDKTTKKSD